MSRNTFSNKLVLVKLLPAALAAALVVCASVASAQDTSYQNPPADQNASYDQSAPAQASSDDPPDRVARLAYLSGDVELAAAGENDWGTADINRPLTTGDRLLTGNDGRAALELGDAALRINDNSAFNFLDLNDTTTQVELSQGTLNLRVRQLSDGETYEIDTPTVAFVASQPGTYRVDVDPNGNGAMVTVFEGAGTVYGENGVSRPVDAGQSYRFNDTTLVNVEVQGVPAPDDFDRFCDVRDSRYIHSISRRYVSPDVVGYDDLDQYGDWQSTPDYGEVWYPTQVAADWAPYRDGHWAWIEPWGWTWVDDEPWGYAPFHYGRWAYVRNRWGWIPGQREIRPVYAPALVAFVGGGGLSLSINLGGGEPVGWFPLGPRDVYVPPYRASRNYFTNINVTNIRSVYVNKTVINNYYGGYAAGRPYAGRTDYAYRNNPRAFTAVPRNVFAGAKPVRAAVLHVNPASLAKATIAPMPHIAPTRESLGIRPARRPIAAPIEKSFQRTVVARHAPPPRPVPFAAREKVIASHGGAPIPVAQLQQMRQQHAQAQPEPQRVHVVAAAPKRGAPLPPMKQAPGQPPATAHGAQPPMVRAPRPGEPIPPHQANAIHPIQVPLNPSSGGAPNRPARAPLRPGELPSARFAHPQREAGPGNANAPEQRAAQARETQAQQDQQRAEQARQQANQARQNGEQAQAQANEQRAQAAQAQALQHEAQARQQGQEAQAQQAQQRAEQSHAQQAQQRAEQERQRADQNRAQQEQIRAQAAQQQAQQHAEQARAQQEQQRAEQAHAQQQQREEQMRAQQQAQQRQAQEAQMRAQQQEQQRAQQAQQRQAQETQMRAQQQEQ